MPATAAIRKTGRQSPRYSASWVARMLAQAGVTIQASDRRACARARLSLLNQRISTRAEGTNSVPISSPNNAMRRKYSRGERTSAIQPAIVDQATTEKSKSRFAPKRSVKLPEMSCAGA